jgi:signal transduction histidine kinase
MIRDRTCEGNDDVGNDDSGRVDDRSIDDRGTLLKFIARTPSGARSFVHSTLEAWHRDDLVDDAELLVSELVTNALMHTGATHASVGITAHDDIVRIEVEDPSPVPLVRAVKTDLSKPGGLGLGIVDSIARRWGVVQADRSKTVWFELSAVISVAVPVAP